MPLNAIDHHICDINCVRTQIILIRYDGSVRVDGLPLSNVLRYGGGPALPRKVICMGRDRHMQDRRDGEHGHLTPGACAAPDASGGALPCTGSRGAALVVGISLVHLAFATSWY